MMTVDLVAHNSTRNTVACLVCSQTAGTAAAVAAAQEAGPLDVNAQHLREMLLSDGAVLDPRPDPFADART